MSSELPTAEPQFLIDQDYERFAPTYTPEAFTPQEQKYLKPFFTNLDKPVFAMHALPQEMMGALASRYSRAQSGLRRVFMRDYVEPMVKPWTTEEWKTASLSEKARQLSLRHSFLRYARYLNMTGGIDHVVAAQRARDFFDKWLVGYGDDSIAELGAVQVCVEGASNLVANDIEMQRIGISPIEKSTRYVRWEREKTGSYPYAVPGELKGTPLEDRYKSVMDRIFDVYTGLGKPYLQYIMGVYPKEDEETPEDFKTSRAAKRLDDIRDLLPFGSKTSLAFLANGRADENLINRLMASDVGESRWWAQQIYRVLQLEVPSFVKRAGGARGEKMQKHRIRQRDHKKNTQPVIPPEIMMKEDEVLYKGKWASLLDITSESDVKILARYYLRGSEKGIPKLEQYYRSLSAEERASLLAEILKLRFENPEEPRRESDRFNKPPRPFESSILYFALQCRAGDYRDLQRHRMMSQDRGLFTTKLGFDIDQDLQNSPFFPDVIAVFEEAAQLYTEIADTISPEAAQYVVPMGCIQDWYANVPARELYWIAELRTSPQARPHYKEVVLEMADAALKVAPEIFWAMQVNRESHPISRREETIRARKKLAAMKGN